MGLKYAVLLALSGTQAWAASDLPAKRQSTTAKYCPGGTEICFSEFREPTNDIAYRIAIPDVASAPFDVLLQIVAPINKAGWAGIAWGGKMNLNPLTVAWPNGGSVVASSRWSTGRTVPGAYAGATYAVLPSTTANATHWQLDVLCTGCSKWEGGSLDPNGVNNLAWAKNTNPVNSPSSNTSSFGIHDGRGFFSHDLSVAKIPKGVFDAVVYGLQNPETTTIPPKPTTSSAGAAISTRLTELPHSSSSSSSSSKTPPVVVVTTRVTELPKPTTSTTKKVTTSPVIVTVTVTAKPPTTTTTTQNGDGESGVWPPWATGGGGGPPWGKGKGGPPWGKHWPRRERIVVRPEE